MFRNTPDGEWEFKYTEVAQVANIVYALTDEERLELLQYFCVHCGTNDIKCNCWRDE